MINPGSGQGHGASGASSEQGSERQQHDHRQYNHRDLDEEEEGGGAERVRGSGLEMSPLREEMDEDPQARYGAINRSLQVGGAVPGGGAAAQVGYRPRRGSGNVPRGYIPGDQEDDQRQLLQPQNPPVEQQQQQQGNMQGQGRCRKYACEF